MRCARNRVRSIIAPAAALGALALLAAAGCASPKYTTEAPPETAHATLSEGYALLHTLLAQNQRVAGIFMVKGASEDLRRLIQDIATASADGRKQIEAFAEADPALSIEGASLPLIEVETRSAIEKTVSSELLGSAGDELERRLAVEQIKATRYASHLAASIAAIDTDAQRAAFLDELNARFETFHARLQATLGNGL